VTSLMMSHFKKMCLFTTVFSCFHNFICETV